MSYPIMLNLEGKSCVIVGGGRVATRKVSHLINTGAHIIVISPEITETLKQWHSAERIEWIEQAYSFEVLSNRVSVLVFAATDSPSVNQQVANDSERIGAWCNIVDDPDNSDFHNMALVKNPPITIAISTDGTSPALLQLIKAEVEQFLGAEYSILANWLKNLRDSANNQLKTQVERQFLYENIVQSDILDLLREGRESLAKERFEALVEGAIS